MFSRICVASLLAVALGEDGLPLGADSPAGCTKPFFEYSAARVDDLCSHQTYPTARAFSYTDLYVTYAVGCDESDTTHVQDAIANGMFGIKDPNAAPSDRDCTAFCLWDLTNKGAPRQHYKFDHEKLCWKRKAGRRCNGNQQGEQRNALAHFEEQCQTACSIVTPTPAGACTDVQITDRCLATCWVPAANPGPPRSAAGGLVLRAKMNPLPASGGDHCLQDPNAFAYFEANNGDIYCYTTDNSHPLYDGANIRQTGATDACTTSGTAVGTTYFLSNECASNAATQIAIVTPPTTPEPCVTIPPNDGRPTCFEAAPDVGPPRSESGGLVHRVRLTDPSLTGSFCKGDSNTFGYFAQDDGTIYCYTSDNTISLYDGHTRQGASDSKVPCRTSGSSGPNGQTFWLTDDCAKR
eukprot:m.256295 g.256295  ORF g.256295 m.256295 type:complete len:409 (+) comp34238_c0_seq1:91-1317(+)